ncbi:competence type IV pilus major pilin ComGC [Levilactobacillus angrenensis]|uniref:Competence type IV pilus major pilin ComGC n=1 Tax=Levilactobacillus angrenensis TaxID=2486020 RepID=A0ABW1U9U2_9LACO|nr:competence type IV pilus major pilin ComGC [Levilactobacillus angrenensis]
MIKRRQGFTLVEMTIVLFIISLLILIILPNLNNQRKRANQIHGHAMVTVVQGQVTAYLEDHPGHHYVDYAALTQEKYLTADQAKRAQEEHIKIVEDRAVADAK